MISHPLPFLQMRDAYVALSNLKERTGREAILSKYEKLMAEKFVRTEPLGTDRHGRRYWVFEGDSRCVACLRCGLGFGLISPPQSKQFLYSVLSFFFLVFGCFCVV